MTISAYAHACSLSQACAAFLKPTLGIKSFCVCEKEKGQSWSNILVNCIA